MKKFYKRMAKKLHRISVKMSKGLEKIVVL